MFKNKKMILAVFSGLLVLAIGATALVSVSKASASSLPAQSVNRVKDMLSKPGGRGDFPGKGGEDNTYLAQALGITTEELQAAQQAAWTKAIDQALEKGLITQAQADKLKARNDGFFGRGGNPFGMLLVDDNSIDMNALLAQELGITVDDLQAAREKDSELALQARIDSGEITQEQADLMKARQALKDYINPEKLTAQALGMTVEELQAARQAGKDMATLLEEKGMTQEEFQAAQKAAYEAAVKQAVADGVITQAQADLVLANPDNFWAGGMPGYDGGHRGGRGGRPGDNGGCPAPDRQPQNAPADQNNG
jgi:hypothetical protein